MTAHHEANNSTDCETRIAKLEERIKLLEAECAAAREMRDVLEYVCFEPIGGDRVADGRIDLRLFTAYDKAREAVGEL